MKSSPLKIQTFSTNGLIGATLHTKTTLQKGFSISFLLIIHRKYITLQSRRLYRPFRNARHSETLHNVKASSMLCLLAV